MKKTKSKRGGKREGAGRKETVAGGRVRAITLSDAAIAGWDAEAARRATSRSAAIDQIGRSLAQPT